KVREETIDDDDLLRQGPRQASSTGILYLKADVPFDREIGKLQQQHEHDRVLLSRADFIVKPIGITGPQLGVANPDLGVREHPAIEPQPYLLLQRLVVPFL